MSVEECWSRGACAAAVRSWTTTDHALVSHADVDVVVVFVVVVATPSDRAVRVSSSSTRLHVAATRIFILECSSEFRSLSKRSTLCARDSDYEILSSSFVVYRFYLSVHERLWTSLHGIRRKTMWPTGRLVSSHSSRGDWEGKRGYNNRGSSRWSMKRTS